MPAKRKTAKRKSKKSGQTAPVFNESEEFGGNVSNAGQLLC